MSLNDGTDGPIETVIAAWDDIDHNEGRRVHEFFVPDGTIIFDQYSVQGIAAIEDVYRARRDGTARVTRHVATNVRVEPLGDGSVRVRSTLVLFADNGNLPLPSPEPKLVADVSDVLEMLQGRWLIRSRRICHVFIAPETVLGVPVR